MTDFNNPPNMGGGGGPGFKAAVQAIINIPQSIYLIANLLNKVFPVGGSNLVSGSVNTNGNTSVLLIPPIAGKRIYINAFSLVNTGNNSAAVAFQDGNGGPTLWEGFTIAAPNSPGDIDTLTNLTPIFATSIGNGLYFQSATATTTLFVSASGFSA